MADDTEAADASEFTFTLKVCSSAPDDEIIFTASDDEVEVERLNVDVERSEGLDELMLEILYGDRIRKTIERLNYEWLKKMWKASDDDFRVFWFEQIRKKFEEHED